MRAPESKEPAGWTFEFTKEELRAIHQSDLEGVLSLKDFRSPSSRNLYSFAHKTLGYELWLREIRLAFKKRLFHSVKATVHHKNLLARLDALAQTLGHELATMADKEADSFEPPQPIRQAILVRARNEAQAQELVRCLEAAEVVLGEVAGPLDAPEERARRRPLAEDYRDRAAAAYLPVVRTYYWRRASYLDYLVRCPGTPFYPGRPPKRKVGSVWCPAGRPRGKGVGSPPWRPVYRPWADESGGVFGPDRWAEHERHVVGCARRGLDRKADIGRSGEEVLSLGLSFPPRPVLESAKPQTSMVSKWVSQQAQLTMPGDEKPDDAKTGTEDTGDDQEDGRQTEDLATALEAEQSSLSNDEKPEDLAEDLKAELDSLFDAESEEDSEREGSDASSEEEPDRFSLVETYKTKLKWRPLVGQGTYEPAPAADELPKVNGGQSWKRHYEELLELLEQAKVNNYWDNYMQGQDPVAKQAVARIAGLCQALAPAAATVRDGNRKHKLGYGCHILAKAHADAFFNVRMEVERARRFIWRSAEDFAIGIMHYHGRGPVGVI